MYKYIFHILVISCLSSFANDIIYSDGILAKVNGKIITSFELEQMTKDTRERILQRYTPDVAKKRIAELNKSALDQFINNVIILDEFKTKKYEVPKALIDKEMTKELDQRTGGDHQKFAQMLDRNGLSMEEYREQMMEGLAIELMVNENVRRKISVTPVQISNYYNENLNKFATNAEVKLAIILITKANKTDEAFNIKVRKIEKELNDKKDFALLADSHSEMPGANKGGDLGFKKLDELNENVREIASTLSVGQHSGQILFGENIAFIKVLEKKGGNSRPLIEVRERIKNLLEDIQERKYYIEFITGLRKKASIEVFGK